MKLAWLALLVFAAQAQGQQTSASERVEFGQIVIVHGSGGVTAATLFQRGGSND